MLKRPTPKFVKVDSADEAVEKLEKYSEAKQALKNQVTNDSLMQSDAGAAINHGLAKQLEIMEAIPKIEENLDKSLNALNIPDEVASKAVTQGKITKLKNDPILKAISELTDTNKDIKTFLAQLALNQQGFQAPPQAPAQNIGPVNPPPPPPPAPPAPNAPPPPPPPAPNAPPAPPAGPPQPPQAGPAPPAPAQARPVDPVATLLSKRNLTDDDKIVLNDALTTTTDTINQLYDKQLFDNIALLQGFKDFEALPEASKDPKAFREKYGVKYNPESATGVQIKAQLEANTPADALQRYNEWKQLSRKADNIRRKLGLPDPNTPKKAVNFLDELKQKVKPIQGSGNTKYKVDKETGQFGNVLIDLPKLTGFMKLEVYNMKGKKIISRKVDMDFVDLITKRFDKKRQYSENSVKLFDRLVKGAGIPYNKLSNKTKLLKHEADDLSDDDVMVEVKYYSSPDDLVKRMGEIIESGVKTKKLKNELSEILDKLVEAEVITKEDRNKLSTTYIG